MTENDQGERRINMLMNNKEKWYGNAVNYWSNATVDVQGMLQGYEKISDIDCSASKDFIKKLQREVHLTSPLNRALDCGGGIGRVSKHFLLQVFQTVDILEQEPNFTANIPAYLGEEYRDRCERVFTQGMQEFDGEEARYDVVWIQWVIGHLTDDDFVKFMRDCVKWLTPGGCLCIKDNVATGSAEMDEEDYCVTRTHEQFKDLFGQGGMRLACTEKQKGFPARLFTVNMYALRPIELLPF